jgi:hypothetical protein
MSSMRYVVQQTFGISVFRLRRRTGEIRMRLYKNRETLETTADYGLALEWRSAGMSVSEYQKTGEL